MIKKVLSPVGDEKVVEAIVVVVGYADALAPARVLQSCFSRHVLEPEVPEIAKKAAGRLRLAFPIAPLRAVDQEYVGQPVIIEIEDGDAAARGFDQVRLVHGVTRYVSKREARTSANVLEPDFGRGARGASKGGGSRFRFTGHHALTVKQSHDRRRREQAAIHRPLNFKRRASWRSSSSSC